MMFLAPLVLHLVMIDREMDIEVKQKIQTVAILCDQVSDTIDRIHPRWVKHREEFDGKAYVVWSRWEDWYRFSSPWALRINSVEPLRDPEPPSRPMPKNNVWFDLYSQ